MKKAITVLLLIVCVGCKQGKNEYKQKESTIAIGELDNLNLELLLEVKVPMDDIFELYYYESGEKTFSSENFVYNRVKGSEIIQILKFEIPDNVYPERLRLDFGKNINQEKMTFAGAILKYGDKEYVFSELEINEQFKPSKFMLFDPETREIITQKINNKYDPYFYTMKVNGIVNYLLED